MEKPEEGGRPGWREHRGEGGGEADGLAIPGTHLAVQLSEFGGQAMGYPSSVYHGERETLALQTPSYCSLF